MGLLEFLKKAFNGESTLAGRSSEIFGRNPGPVSNPLGVVAGLHDSSGGSVGTRYGTAAPVLERVLLDRTLANQAPQLPPMPAPSPVAYQPQMPTPGMAPQAVPPGVPFNPPPMDQGTPLAPPPPQIHDMSMYAPPAQLHPGIPQNAPLAQLMQLIQANPKLGHALIRLYGQGNQPIRSDAGGVVNAAFPQGPGVSMEYTPGQ